MRPSGRAPDQMRPIAIEPEFTIHAEGSVLVSFGNTRVLVTASVDEKVPSWMRGKGAGWVTAEYGMLPRATHTRGNREAAKGKQSGRTQEIQRLIGRPLRAGTSICDIMGGVFGVVGILAALQERNRTGRGQEVRSALFESAAFLMAQHMAGGAGAGESHFDMASACSAYPQERTIGRASSSSPSASVSRARRRSYSRRSVNTSAYAGLQP